MKALRSTKLCPEGSGRYLAFALVIVLGGCSRGESTDFGYDANLDPYAQLATSTALATEHNKSILLLFGANWCEDCRRLSRVMADETVKPTIDRHFVVMHVDIGNWDHNTEFVAAWGNPTAGGIPAVVVIDAGNEVIYRTAPGELATARHKGLDELRSTFEQMAMWHELYNEEI